MDAQQNDRFDHTYQTEEASQELKNRTWLRGKGEMFALQIVIEFLPSLTRVLQSLLNIVDDVSNVFEPDRNAY